MQQELTNKDNIIQCLLTQLSKQTDIIRKQHYQSQREVLIDRNNIQHKNVHQSDTKQTDIDEYVEWMAPTDDLILKPESITETTQADHTTSIKVKEYYLSDKKVTTQVHLLFQRK